MHDPIGAIEVALLEKPDEVRTHGMLLRWLHGEIRARPVQGTSEHPQLPLDAGAVVVHPFPHLLEELLAAQLLAGDALLRELVLDDDLRDDPGVVGARHVKRGLPSHAVVAGHEVLVATETERVTDVQVARDVRQRQHHDERLLGVAWVGREEPALFPPRVEVGLDGGRVEVLFRQVER